MEQSTDTGTLVQRYLFSPLSGRASAWAIFRWWERRRLFYNLVVGATGLVTLTAALLFSVLPSPPGTIIGPLMAVPIYAILANVCYSLGAPIDWLLRRRLGDEAGPVAQALFRYGLGFSIGLTLLPIPVFVLGWLFSFLAR